MHPFPSVLFSKRGEEMTRNSPTNPRRDYLMFGKKEEGQEGSVAGGE
jgi:hypothetical protein